MSEQLQIVETNYQRIQRCDPGRVHEYAREIRNIIATIGWDSVSFTEGDLVQIERRAKITIAERYYRISLLCDRERVSTLLKTVRAIANECGWSNMSFTPATLDLLERTAESGLARRRY